MESVEPDGRLLIFTKPPIAGRVKTRMQPHLTPSQSAILHQNMVRHCLKSFAHFDQSQWAVELWVAGNHPWWGELRQKYAFELFQQSGRDLGRRLSYAATDALRRSTRVMIIGTDCPYLTEGYLAGAFQQLAEHDVILGPANDGGYVMIGLKEPESTVFENVSWGSDKVLEQTVNQLQQANKHWKTLDVLADIDRPEDLQLLTRDFPKLVDNLGCFEPVIPNFTPA